MAEAVPGAQGPTLSALLSRWFPGDALAQVRILDWLKRDGRDMIAERARVFGEALVEINRAGSMRQTLDISMFDDPMDVFDVMYRCFERGELLMAADELFAKLNRHIEDRLGRRALEELHQGDDPPPLKNIMTRLRRTVIMGKTQMTRMQLVDHYSVKTGWLLGGGDGEDEEEEAYEARLREYYAPENVVLPPSGQS